MLDTVGVMLAYFYPGWTHTGYAYLCVLELFAGKFSQNLEGDSPHNPETQAQAPARQLPFALSPPGPESILNKQTLGSVS